ncbi:fused response regulator/phosphatase [Streptomyces sp. PLK6-54]|uniref:Fused response regulator/phosphatase n=1 Tax=Actinacidiphila acidipaludis TaxID=2873382 RepID=A0ABS7QB71_9ACTN|nr:fused response regulator/phosphatase [Streptomyces acidipaludis]
MPAPAPAAEAFRLLLVEDDSGDALLVEEYLSDTTLRVRLHWSQTLADAMDRMAQEPPDCVLLDLHLPDASGIDAVRQTQAVCPSAAVIVLTGMAESRAGVDAVAAGAQDYLVKSTVNGELLDRAIRYAVHRKNAEQTAARLRLNEQRAQENQRLERGLLPVPLRTGTAVATASCYLPGREGALLAGDFLDVVETPDGTLHAVIGDVSGHGPDAAAIGVCLRIAWRTLILGGHRDAGLLGLIEQLLVAERTSSSLFATVATLSLTPGSDGAAARMRITLAGHEAPLLLEKAAAGPLPARQVNGEPGIALGLVPGAAGWRTVDVPLPAAGSLLLFTDGLTEGHVGPGSLRLGTEGLMSLVDAAPPLSGRPLVDHLATTAQEMDAGRHQDDIALLMLSW